MEDMECIYIKELETYLTQNQSFWPLSNFEKLNNISRGFFK